MPGFPNYRISSAGEVWSAGYRDRRGWWRKPKRIGGGRDGSGYRQVALVGPDGQRMRKVHLLLCEAWHGSRPAGMQARHQDGDQLNNTPGNVTWGTPSENMRDQVRHGTHVNTRKTRCPRGHQLALPAMGKRRRCRLCENDGDRRRYAERKALR